MRFWFPILLFVSACASSSTKRSTTDLDVDVLWEEQAPALDSKHTATDSSTHQNLSAQKPGLFSTNYHLSWQGKRIGEVREVFHRSETGVRIIRRESIRISRGGVPVDSETEIIIYADKDLYATRVELRAKAGAVSRKGNAIRADDGQWVIALEGEKVRKAPKNAVPIELIPYWIAQNNSDTFKGNALLAGYGFAVAPMRLQREGKHGQAILETPWGDIVTQLAMNKDGSLLKAATGSTGSVRVNKNRLNDSYKRTDLPNLSSIPLRGKGNTLVITNTNRRPPPALSGQSIALRKQGWSIQFPTSPRQVSPRIKAMVREVDALLKDSHDAPGAGAKDAMTLGRGDCTAHSTLLVDLALEQGIEAKLVTGFRINSDKLVRHRWVTLKQGKEWIQVDPTFGEAPVSPAQHLALAVHGDSTAQIALVDEAVFRGFEKAKANWVQGKLNTP